jgi:hypothetical protein
MRSNQRVHQGRKAADSLVTRSRLYDTGVDDFQKSGKYLERESE